MALKTYTWETGDYAYQSWSNNYKIHLTLTEESTSTANNTSLVSYKFWISNGSNNRFYDNYWSWSISIGGQTIAINNFDFYVYPYNVTQIIASGQITVTHNSDGSLNMPFNVSIPNIKAVNKYAPPAMAISGTWALTTIPRQASITSASSFTDEKNPTIYYNNPAGNAATSLQACIANDAGGVQYAKYRDIPKTGTSYQFVLTDAEKSALYAATPNSNTLNVRFYVKTVIGGTSYYSNLAKTMSIVNANPIVSTSAVDTNSTAIALTGDNTKFIKYYSNVKVTATATAQKGATITSTTGTGTFNNVQTKSWNVVATDSRGNTTKKAASGTLVPYVKLTCNIENTSPDASGNMTVRCDGSYFNGSFGATSNTLTVKCRYKSQSGSYSSWYTMTVTKSGNYYSAYYTFTIPNFNYLSTYTFQCQAVDKLETVSSSPRSVKSTPVFHWSESDFVFEVPVTFNAGVNNSGAASAVTTDQTIDGDLHVTGDLRLKGSGNYGNTLRFGDGNYCYITEPTDDVMTIKASSINLEANNVKVYGNPIPTLATGVWSPTLSSSAVSSYSTQYGWYSKIGQTVSVGFYVKATCRSGYNSTLVTIGGLPFSPLYSGAGGGMCAGAYVSAGFTFQCFVAETDGSISTRVQACNNTTTANLSTSKSGCWYPSGGGDITISGTITYISG
jgi:hypothetical protein